MKIDCIFEFSYASILADGVGPREMLALAQRSWSENRRSGVTGILECYGRQIRQTIEGPGDVVLPLAARILCDPRHGSIVVRAFGSAPARRFVDWRVEGLGAMPVAVPQAGFDLQVVAGRGANPERASHFGRAAAAAP